MTEQQAWEPWVLYMVCGTHETAEWTLQIIQSIHKEIEDIKAIVKGKLPRVYSHELVELIFMKPYTRISDVTDAGIAKRQTASEYLGKLVKIGILSIEVSGREKLFLNTRLLNLLRKA